MRSRVAATLLMVAGVTLLVAVGSARERRADRRTPSESIRPDSAIATEARIRDLDIAFYDRRAKEDPWSAGDRARLAGLFLQRARETGNFTDFQRAESVAVNALRLRETHNEETFSILAAARLAMHDFAGALVTAQRLVARYPDEPRHRALLGEVLLELGRYDEAARAFQAIELQSDRLSVTARLARWYELTGRLTHARNVMRYALRRAVEERSLTREQEAWFHLRLGELELKTGAVERAESLFVKGLEHHPGDYRLLGALARAAAVRGDWMAAIDAGERAALVQLDPATLGVVSESYAAIGDWQQSASYAKAMRASALIQPGSIHRAWGLFLLDHGTEATEVLKRARQELATRRDVYGYDLVAWALHVLGRDAEAWPFMEQALSQKTEDATLWHHASAIARGRGDTTNAELFASQALAVNPRFHATLFQAAADRRPPTADQE